MKVKSRMISWIVCISMLMGMLCTTVSAQSYSTTDIPGDGQVWSSGVYGAYGYAVVGNGSANGLYVINNINDAAIAFGERINSDKIVTDRRNAYVAGEYLFYSSNDMLYRYRLSETPEAPAVVAQYDAYKTAYYITSANIGGTEYVYVCYNDGIAIFDLSKPEDAAPTVMAIGRVNAVGVSETHIYPFSNNRILSYAMTYGDTITSELTGEQALSGENAISPGSAAYVDGYICISDQRGSGSEAYGGSILIIDADKLENNELSTYRYYSRGSQADQAAANIQMVAIDAYKGLLLAIERCHNARPSMAFALDISDPANPVRIWETDVAGGPVSVFIHDDRMYLSSRADAYQVVPIDTGAFCKISNIKNGDTITELPFTVSGVAVDVDTVTLDLGGITVEVPVEADGSWSYHAAYCENGALTVRAIAGEYVCERTVHINVPTEITLTGTLTQAGVPQANLVSGDVALDVLAANNTDSAVSAALYAVLYNGDDIVSMESHAIELEAGASNQAVITGKGYTVDAGVLANSALKVFAVTNTGDIVLLSDVLTYVPEGYAPSSTDRTAAGSEDVNIDIEPDHTAVQAEILGTLPENANKTVLLTVYQPNAADLSGIDYINVIKTNNQGSFLVKYHLGTPAIEEQDYVVKAAVKGLDGIWKFNGESDTFKYYGPSYQDRALQALNDAQAAAVIDIIEEYNLVYGIDLGENSDYALLGNGSFYQDNVKTAMAETTFAAVSEVKPYFAGMVLQQQLLKSINEEDEAAALKTMLEDAENAAMLGIDSSYLYEDLEEAQKEAVIEAVMKGRTETPYQTVDAFLEQYEQQCALAYINGTSYTNMAEALKAANKTLQLNLTGDYATLANVENQLIYVHKILDRTTFATVEEIRTTFASAVRTAMGNKGNTGGNGGGNGGSNSNRGSGSIISVVPDPGTQIEIPEPVVETEPEIEFTDLDAGHWAKPYIDDLVNAGIVSGYGDGSIRPDAYITRAEFIKILIDAYKLEDENYVSSFNDVQKTDKFYDWYYNSVATAQALGLVAGDENGNFNPNAYITRQDMAVILNKMYEKQGIEGTGAAASYVDAAEITEYARESVDAVSELGVMTGVGDNRFDPKANVTRAMAFRAISFSLDMQ